MKLFKSKSKKELIREIEILKQQISESDAIVKSHSEYKNEDKYRNLMEQSPVATLIFNSKFEITDVNDAFVKLWGISLDDLIKIREKYNFLKDDQINKLNLLPYLKRASIGETVVLPEFEYDASETMKKMGFSSIKGKKCWIKARIYPVKNSDNKILYFILSEEDISEQKLAEQKLIESETKYRMLFDNAFDAIVLSRLSDGINVDVNKTFTELTGHKKEDVTGKVFSKTNIWKNKDELNKQLKILKEKGAFSNVEANFVSKDGRNGVGLMSAQKISINGTDYVLSVSRDITKQKNIEQALKESEERYRNLIENAPIGIAIHQDEKLIFINKKGLKLIKAKSNEQVIGKPIKSFIPKENLKRVKKEIDLRLKNERSVEFSFDKYVQLDGNIIDVEVISSTVQFNNKPATQIIVSDVTKRKKIEKEIQDKTIQFKVLSEAAGDALFVSDFETEKIIYGNNQACKSLGYTKEELLKLKVSDLDPVFMSEDHKGKMWENMIPGKNVTIEALHKRKDGSVFPVEIRTGLIEFNEKKAVLGFARDISERKKNEIMLKNYQEHLEILVKIRTDEAEEKTLKIKESQKALTYLLEDINTSRNELLKTNIKLEQINKDLEAFAYSVSHDLKSPLRAVSGYTNAIMEDYKEHLNDDVQEYLNLVIKNSNYMNLIINDLFRFAKTAANEVFYSEFNLSTLVQDTFNTVKQQYPNKNPELIIKEECTIKADLGTLKQVIVNLLSNSIKYSKTNEKPIIEFGSQMVNEKKYYFIKDNGIGFDMKFKKKIFDVFKRLHTSDAYEGTGIGLALVKRIIEKHNGDIFVKSVEGVGSTFFFHIPQ